jgi:hypothetical protein
MTACKPSADNHDAAAYISVNGNKRNSSKGCGPTEVQPKGNSHHAAPLITPNGVTHSSSGSYSSIGHSPALQRLAAFWLAAFPWVFFFANAILVLLCGMWVRCAYLCYLAYINGPGLAASRKHGAWPPQLRRCDSLLYKPLVSCIC